MGLFSKLGDAASMFWLNCDAMERQIVLVLGIYLLMWLVRSLFGGFRRWVAAGVTQELERREAETAA